MKASTASPVTVKASVASGSLLAADEEDSDDGHDGLRQRGADRGEYAADRAGGEVQLRAEPLDRIGEQLTAKEDDDESTGGEGEFDDQPIRPPNL